MRLSGKNVLITGGNSGIGLAIAHRFRDEGARGVIAGRNSETLESASQSLGPDFLPLQCDVTKHEELENLYKTAEEQWGKIDVLVVNAGGSVGAGTIQLFEHVDEDCFDAITNLNMKSTFYTVQKSLSHLNDGASIILISSIAAHKGFSGMSVYSACKAAVRNFARSFSAELMPRGIRVNVLSPGTIDTPVFEKFGFSEEEMSVLKDQFKELIPLKRTGTPEEMGGVAVFLACSDSSFVIGEEIIADGGVVNL